MTDPVVAVVEQVRLVDPRTWVLIDLLERSFVPADPGHFGVDVQVFISDGQDTGVDSFDVVVCSPSWLAERVSAGFWTPDGTWEGNESVKPGNAYWFMRTWDQPEFLKALEDVCKASSPGPDWGAVADRIGRFIPWEYDYRYDEKANKQAGLPPPRGWGVGSAP